MTFDDHIFTLCNEACMQLNAIDRLKHYLGKNKWVLLNRVPTSTQLHSPPPSSTHLHPAYFSLHPALCNTLNNIWTKILHVIGQFPQILTKNWHTWYFGGVDSESRLRFLKFRPQNPFLGKFGPKKSKLCFVKKLVHMVSQRCWFLFQH